MASSLSSLNPPCPPSLHFLTLHSKPHFPFLSTSTKFKISCSQQTIQFDEIIHTKTKRKLRPSFLEQIRNKWSVKPTIVRRKFPWEEQKEQDRESIQEDKDQRFQFSRAVVSESEERSDSESESGSLGSGSKGILAPWVHGNKPGKTQIDVDSRNSETIQVVEEQSLSLSENSSVSASVSLDSRRKVTSASWVHENKPSKSQLEFDDRNSDKSGGKRNNVNGFSGHSENKVLGNVVQESRNLESGTSDNVKCYEKVRLCGGKSNNVNGFSGHSGNKVLGNVVRESKNLEGETRYTVKCEEKVVKFDANPIGLSDKNEILLVETNNSASFCKKSSNSDHEVGNFEGFVNERVPVRLPWEKKSVGESVEGDKSRKSNTKLAESVIPEPELKRLRNVSLRMVERIKVGSGGITQAVVDSIHKKWKVDEVVKLKFEAPCSMNMRRTTEVLENKTRGLVIWRSGSSIVLFRGMSYNLHCVQSYGTHNEATEKISESSKGLVSDSTQIGRKSSTMTMEFSTTDEVRYLNSLSKKELQDLSELNALLDELGPRFKDWSGRYPMPVDADLLPAVVPGYKTPYRLLPYGTRPSLRDKETTFYRQTARTMPPHFALGRNRELQGLAQAMVKLWQKSAIAKIAIKRGVQNTNNERMAEELKVLTGGTLLSRNKDYIVFYRGNDFLPPRVTERLVEAQNLTTLRQDEEERARQKASSLIDSAAKTGTSLLVAGTLSETTAATSRWANQPSDEDIEEMKRNLALERHASLVRHLEKKLARAKGKVTKAEKALLKVQEYLEPASLPTDLETITDEERFLFRKIGLSMKPYLLLGRRGIYDGTIENMHLHWKHRELVKIIVDRKNFPQVKHIAISLEAESGGVLVSLDKTTKGYAIIVYRGKNYQQPGVFKPRNLLTRRQALARSIELQRREALKHHIVELQEKIEKMKAELEDMKTSSGDIDEKTLSSTIDNTSDEEDDEDEGEEAYLETYNSSNEDDNT